MDESLAGLGQRSTLHMSKADPKMDYKKFKIAKVRKIVHFQLILLGYSFQSCTVSFKILVSYGP
jgi:hypothetical protein